MPNRPRRTARSYIVEALFVGAVLLGLYLFLANGGPMWAGEVLADALTSAR